MARGQIRDRTRARLMGARRGASLGGVFAYSRYSPVPLLALAIILVPPPQISHFPSLLTSQDVVGLITTSPSVDFGADRERDERESRERGNEEREGEREEKSDRALHRPARERMDMIGGEGERKVRKKGLLHTPTQAK